MCYDTRRVGCERPGAAVNVLVVGGTGPTAGVALTTEEFERARDSYYQLAGCDPATGYPTRAKLTALGLDWLADKVPAAR